MVLTPYYNQIIIPHMTQKVLQVGSSAGITISKETLKDLGLKVGSQVTVQVDAQKKFVKILPATQSSAEDDKIAKLTMRFIDRYRSDLQALANK